jgi:hypothetical protein
MGRYDHLILVGRWRPEARRLNGGWPVSHRLQRFGGVGVLGELQQVPDPLSKDLAHL